MPQERRLATVLFADIVGSSGVTDSHDPEVVRHTLATAFSAMRKVLIEHGGTVEKFIGDAVMAVFGVPAAHDDDAARAIRAALALRSAVRVAASGDDLRLRIGINTGEVVAGDEEHAETLVTGTPVIVASRLQSAAAPDEILVGTLTRRLTDDRIDYGPARSVAAKNLGQIEASPVLGTVSRPHASVVSIVGRATELARLRAVRDELTRSGGAKRVTLIGPAGIGKSRIAQEIGSEGDAAWGRCAAYGEADTLAPLHEIVRALVPTAPAGSADRINTLLSGRAWASDVSAEQAQKEIAEALARFFDATYRGTVTTVVVDDLQAAEPALLEILDEVRVRVRDPLLVLGLARPEILERAWAWVARGETLLLGPLASSHTQELARSLLGERASPDVLAAIVGRAAGIPLYVEQVARTVIEGGDPQEIPPTLRGLISARLDRAGAAVHRLLQRGSVLGRDFWLDAVPWEAGSGIAEIAAEAETRGLISVLDTPGPSGEPTVRFSHALIRDVAYASTTKVERIRLHSHYAEWLGADRRERADVDAIAFHVEQAFRYATEIEHHDARRLGAAAFEALMSAMWSARGRADFRSALSLAGRALEAGGRASVPAERMAEALGHQAMARLRLEPDVEALQLLDRAIEAAREVHLGEVLVRLLMWRVGIDLATDVERARQLLSEAVEVSRTTDDKELIAYALSRSGMVDEATGDLVGRARALTEARDLALRTDARQWLPDTLAELSANALSQGEIAAAGAHALEAVRAAAEGSPLQRFKASLATSAVLLAEGHAEESIEEARAARSLGREIAGPWALAVSSEALAEAHIALGALTEAREVLAQAALRLDPGSTPAIRPFVARIRSALARVDVQLGDLEAARSAAEAAASVAPPTDVRATACACWSLAEVDAASGRADDARVHFSAALDVIEPTGYRMLAARIRSAYAAFLAQHEVVPKG